MAFSKEIKVIDLMLGIPSSDDRSEWFESFQNLLMDQESQKQFKMLMMSFKTRYREFQRPTCLVHSSWVGG